MLVIHTNAPDSFDNRNVILYSRFALLRQVLASEQQTCPIVPVHTVVSMVTGRTEDEQHSILLYCYLRQLIV